LEESQKAKDLLLSSLTILKEYPENKLLISKVSAYMALGKEDEAEVLLMGSLGTYEERYGKSHIKTAHILGLLGQLAFQRNNIQNAEMLLQKAVEILTSNNHPQSHRFLETLAELYLRKAEEAASLTDIKLSQTLKKQAKSYLEQARKIVEANYPSDSAHFVRLHKKLAAFK
jgi:tetratricopeptide (TPR) repeat protein